MQADINNYCGVCIYNGTEKKNNDKLFNRLQWLNHILENVDGQKVILITDLTRNY